ncbi:MAG: diguanylate cyclase [Actinomycetales bacterium]|nr:diguanylate cyclase [Actinomycetales bacterium]
MTAPPDELPQGRSGRLDREVERRLEDIANTIAAFAALDFDAEARVGPEGDVVDAVAAGVNLLGDTLAASFREVERRVAERTEELALATEELSRRALHDVLTGLPNRALFWDRLAQTMRHDQRHRAGFAVLFIDVDDFKKVNDTLGHAAGDRLLVDLAARIRSVLRAGDSAARLGGDEFLALLDDVSDPDEALHIANRLLEAVAGTDRVGGLPSVTISIGVAVSTGRTWTPDEIVAAADAAMYDAKHAGRGRVVLYSEARHGRHDHLASADHGLADLLEDDPR